LVDILIFARPTYVFHMGFIDRQSILIEEITASYLFILKITMLTDII
jgi:hypothetical protein